MWFDISKFMTTTSLHDYNGNYLKDLEQFEANVKEFYICGKNTFLTSSSVGDAETMYTHILRFYLPKIARTTYERHTLGLGIFTMQGFERRNKESKNCFRRFTNGKNNVVLQNIKRVWEIYDYEQNNV